MPPQLYYIEVGQVELKDHIIIKHQIVEEVKEVNVSKVANERRSLEFGKSSR